MKKFSIKCTDSNMEEAMAKISEISELDPRQKNCLTLLTEELYSMMGNLLSNNEATFAIAREDNTWTLTMTINTHASRVAKENYLSLASDGKNQAHKGLKGLLTAFLDSLSEADASGMYLASTLVGDTVDYAQSWQLSQYLNTLNDQEKALAWDGLERSIIANFADDITVGATENKIKVVVKKTF